MDGSMTCLLYQASPALSIDSDSKNKIFTQATDVNCYISITDIIIKHILVIMCMNTICMTKIRIKPEFISLFILKPWQ